MQLIQLPTEILEIIGHNLCSVRDAVILCSTCTSLRNTIGPYNNFYWFKWRLHATDAQFYSYFIDFNYYSCIVRMLVGKTNNHCQDCFINTCYFSKYFQKRLCDNCLSKYVIHILQLGVKNNY